MNRIFAGARACSGDRGLTVVNNTVKLVVGLTMMAIAASLLIRFRNLIGPLLLAFVLAYCDSSCRILDMQEDKVFVAINNHH